MMSEGAKQAEFKVSTANTVKILVNEWATGTGPQSRAFDESNAMTQDIKNSSATSDIISEIEALEPGSENYKKLMAGESVYFYYGMSPDRTGSLDESANKHLDAFSTEANRTILYRGGMEYNVKYNAENGQMDFNVTDQYTNRSAMYRLVDDTNSSGSPRKPGSTTKQSYSFSIDHKIEK